MFGITIATILITVILILLSSYQEYMVNIERSQKNWEAELTNIKYFDAIEIAKNENVKDVSIYSEIGVSEESFEDNVFKEMGMFETKIRVKAYNSEAIKNSNLEIIEGRTPENSNEIIISDSGRGGYEEEIIVGQKVKLTIEGIEREYRVVGKVQKLEFDSGTFVENIVGAITYFDSDIIKQNPIVDVTIITKDITKIFETVNGIADKLNLTEKQEEQLDEQKMLEQVLVGRYTPKSITPTLEYNKMLLNYAGVLGLDTDFIKTLIIVGMVSISVIAASATVVINSTFKMTYAERIKEFGILYSMRNE